MKLAYSKFVTDESAEEAFLSAVRSIESKLQSYYVEWVRYIATELIHNQVIDEHSSYSEELTKILRSEMIYGMQTFNVHFSDTQSQPFPAPYSSETGNLRSPLSPPV